MSVLYLVIACNVYFFQLVLGQGLQQTPCPGVFRYEKHNQPGYHPLKGVLRIRSRLPINLTVEIFFPLILRNPYYGRFNLVGKEKDVQNSLDNDVEPNLTFNLIYPDNLPIPRLKLIDVNGIVLCSYKSPPAIGTTVRYTYDILRTVIPLEPPLVGNRNLYLWNFTIDYIYYNEPSQHNHPLSPDPTTEYITEVHHSPSLTYHHRPDDVLEDPPEIRPSQPSYRPDSAVLKVDKICGKPRGLNPLIVGGSTAGRGQWPWLVALYKGEETSLTFKCGSTLVSKQFLITAAHCVDGSATSNLKAYVGKYDLSEWNEPNSNLLDISEAHIHPEYTGENAKDFHTDIAILKLRKRVTISRFVVPVCLSFEEEDWSWYLGEPEGLVVGWGNVSPGGHISRVPKMVTLPIVSKEKCIESSEELKNLVTNTTICGGRRNGEGPCNGDSGSGLLISKTDQYGNLRWFLRGIVSISLRKYSINSTGCDLGNYVVFTDVIRFRDWLSQFIPI